MESQFTTSHQFRSRKEVERYLATHAGLLVSRPKAPSQWLERMGALCAALGDPQERYRTIHVAGTSGKGSTTTLIAALLAAHGFRTGHTVSPYVISVRERIQINGHPIAVDAFLRALSRVAKAALAVATSELGHPSSFELITAASFLVFAEAGVDYAVTETGMGGRFDATNVVTRPDKLAVITRIGLDHQDYLGRTLAAIAAEKAAIIQSEGEAIVLRQQTHRVFTDRAFEVGARLHGVDPRSVRRRVTLSTLGTAFSYRIGGLGRTRWQLNLIGRHQVENAVLALEAVSLLAQRDDWPLVERRVAGALRAVSLPARFEICRYAGKTLVIDGAHNTQKLSAFFAALREVYPAEQPVFVVGFRHGKPVRSMLKALKAYDGTMIFTEFRLTNDLTIRSASAKELLQIWEQFEAPSRAQVVTDPLNALAVAATAPEPLVVVTGSLYLAGTVLSALGGVRH